jgi:hypothetical protein
MTASIQLLTITAGLDGSLNVADALDGDAVLVVAVDVLVLELTNLVDQDTKLVRDVGNIVVTCLSPDGELLLLLSARDHRIAMANLQQPPYAPWKQAPCCA